MAINARVLLFVALASSAGCKREQSTPPKQPEVVAAAATARDASPAASPDKAPRSAAVDLAALVEWTSDNPGSEVQLHAADAMLNSLLVELGQHTALVERSHPTRVTCRIAAADQASIERTLRKQANAPLPAAPKLGKRVTYRGRRIDLKFAEADTSDVLRLLSDVYGVNIVVPPTVTGKVNALVKSQPVDRIIDLVIRGSYGAPLSRRGHTMFAAHEKDLFVMRGATRPRIDLIARSATAGELLALLAVAAGGVPATACEGPAIPRLGLRRVTPAEATTAIALASASDLSRQANRCDAARIDKPEQVAKAKLVATLHWSKGAAALFRSESGTPMILKAGPGVEIVPGLVKLEGPGAKLLDEQTWNPDETVLDRLVAKPGRLMATVVSANLRLAFVEMHDGTTEVIRHRASDGGPGGVANVEPGRLTLTRPGEDSPALELSLAYRAAGSP